MKRFLSAVLAILVVSSQGRTVRGDDQDPKAILDKAIKALGGEEKLKKAEAISWKSKGTITFNGEDNDIKTQATFQGLDHYRSELDGEFGGNSVHGVTVLNVDKGWRKFGDNSMELDEAALANTKRIVYLQMLPTTLVSLTGKGFKLEMAGEEKVGDKPAAVIKVTPTDGKEFRLYFDKDSGLPVKLVAKVLDFRGEEYTQETSYTDYKEFDGIKKATKIVSTRDGEKFRNEEITDFKVLDKVDPKTFAEPE
jgi:hypothetical protein